jgi:hypothetical protein
MLLLVLSSETEEPLLDQLAVPRFVFCHNVQPVEGDGHKTFTIVGSISWMANVGGGT